MLSASLIYSHELTRYQLSLTHPLKPRRLAMTHELIQGCGLLREPVTDCREPAPATEEDLLFVHSADYLDAVRIAGAGGTLDDPWHYGLGSSDNPIFGGMYEASALVVGGSLLAAQVVADRQGETAFSIGGGLHHAHRARAAGFCVFNDAAVTIARLLRDQGEGVRIAYVDLDAHHGDGVQEAFYERADVLTVSLHESGQFLFPGTGEVDGLGRGEGEGYAANVPLAPYTDDETYLWVFDQVVPPLVHAFRPDILVVQLGVDTHYLDPITHMALTTHGFLSLVERVRQLPGRLIALGGGGYDLEVVARSWTLAFAALAGLPTPEEIPQPLRARYTSATLHDQQSPSIPLPGEQVRAFANESVELVKRLVFPYHGL